MIYVASTIKFNIGIICMFIYYIVWCSILSQECFDWALLYNITLKDIGYCLFVQALAPA